MQRAGCDAVVAFGRLQRQRGMSASGCSSGFNSVWEGTTLNSSSTNTERNGVRHTCTAQMWLMQGNWKLVAKSNLNRKVKSVQRERGWGMLPDPVGIFQAAWSWIQCLHQLSLVFVSTLKHSVWSKSYWIFTKPFLHAKAFSTLMFKKSPSCSHRLRHVPISFLIIGWGPKPIWIK